MSGADTTLKCNRSRFYTTGVWSSVAAKAAVETLFTPCLCEVEVEIPTGERVVLPVLEAQGGRCSVVKIGGEAEDVTSGVVILAEACFSSKGVIIKAGKGIGFVTKSGLKIPPGEPAINPVPRWFILKNVSDVLKRRNCSLGVEVTLSVLGGERIAKKTVNSKLGILGGISILGTKGIVIPYSRKAFIDSIIAEIRFASFRGLNTLVLACGRESLDYAKVMLCGLSEEAFVLIGDYILFSVFTAKKFGFSRLYLFCQPAKLAKIACGFKHTHVKHGRIDMKKLAVILGLPHIHECNTVREAYFLAKGRWKMVEKQAESNLKRWSGVDVKVVTVDVNSYS